MTDRECGRCGAALSSDAIALYRKLVCREARTYLCLDCLAEALSVERSKLDELIDYYHRTGICCLFEKYEP